MRAVFKMPGSSVAGTAASCAGVCSTAYGAQATPEAAAQALDDEVEDDVLVISRDFDALALVEDELILSLPLVPLHELCPETLPMSVADPAFEAAAERPNPFGVLASLKTDPER